MMVEFIDRVRRLRSCGFFLSEKDLSDEELSTQLFEKAKKTLDPEQFLEVFDPKEKELFELSLAQLDPSRIWWKEMECGVVHGNDTYCEILKEFQVLSNGYFRPEKIEESWESADGPISISFEIDGEAHRYQPEFKYDWLDSGLIDKIYDIFTNKKFPYQLYAYIGRSDDDWGFYGDDILLIRATEKEKVKLSELMKWELMVWA